jgi:NAD(P)-dependent dehydrogenase (short-subunit alcohol dehydrogenase family)
MDGCKEMRLLEKRVAVITGSTKGNGRAMANLFSEVLDIYKET